METIWDGDGGTRTPHSPYSATFGALVDHGLLGNYPETAVALDYPTFERIHYLLVARFNVYGNVPPQLNTRLYMDFLRMEGEEPVFPRFPLLQSDASKFAEHYTRHCKPIWMNPMNGSRSTRSAVTVLMTCRNAIVQSDHRRLGSNISTMDYINRCRSSFACPGRQSC